MKIRFDHPATICLSFAPGDEIQSDVPSPGMLSLLSSVRIDGKHVARVVREGLEHDVADAVTETEPAGPVGRVKRRGATSRPTSVS